MSYFEERRLQGRPGKLEVECNEHINCLEDGFHWRKYGQKKFKGSTSHRFYFKCAHTGTLCPVKKIVCFFFSPSPLETIILTDRAKQQYQNQFVRGLSQPRTGVSRS
eukprot:TRINITY_DN14773_c0_g1_i1.p1 TRINITY_DN14773_c0_g1~~TRINITY_DN14773_c0_g1_i1.p1  ORF type:complete len:107 (-),score=5.80 TRINITY_DN14773_c0_g1_i1:921-1241(-)